MVKGMEFKRLTHEDVDGLLDMAFEAAQDKVYQLKADVVVKDYWYGRRDQLHNLSVAWKDLCELVNRVFRKSSERTPPGIMEYFLDALEEAKLSFDMSPDEHVAYREGIVDATEMFVRLLEEREGSQR